MEKQSNSFGMSLSVILIITISMLTGLSCGSDTSSHTDISGQNPKITRSTVLFTQVGGASPQSYERYKADGIFWGHMPNRSIESDEAIERWVKQVENYTRDGKYYVGRIEFDWGWRWMIDFMENPGDYWAMDLDSNYISWHYPDEYNGHNHNWMSHHGPEFPEFLKYQVDRLLLAPVTQILFDSQTTSIRTLQFRGGDFSIHAMEGFRVYLAEKYTTAELSDRGIEDISKFNYRNYLLDIGFTLESYKEAAVSIEGDIPLYKDFVYYSREKHNEVMDEVLAYIDTKRPGIEICAKTTLVEPRTYVFSDRLTFFAGEFNHPSDPALSPPLYPVIRYKVAEATNKILVFQVYAKEFRDLRDRNAPRQARAWIAQAYAMGSILSGGRCWIGGRETWDPGWENHADIYAFIHDHSELFDDYRALSNAALVYPVYASLLEDNRDGSKTTHQSLEYLIRENISFDLLVFGDPYRPIAPSAGQLEQYDVIIRDSDAQYLTEEQKRLLEGVASKVVSIENPDEITGLLSGRIDVLSNNEIHNNLISALPRISPEPEAPYVLHLLNRKYNAEEDKAQEHPGISVIIPEGLYPGSISGARLHLPGKPSFDLTVQTDNQGNVILDIGTFDSCWGLLELSH